MVLCRGQVRDLGRLMNTITNVESYVFGNVVLTIDASIKPFAGAKESKHVTLRVGLNGMTLKDALAHALESIRIKWANGANGRKKFTVIVDRSTIDVDAKAPGAEVKTRAERIAELEASLGLPHELAVLAIDDPAKFQALLGKVKAPETK